MDYKGKRILILEGYARQCLPFIRSFKKLGCRVSVLCGSRLDISYASRLPDEKILGICDDKRYDESEKCIVELVRSGRFDLVVPMVDFSAGILAKNKTELSRYAALAVNDGEVFDAANDKQTVMEVCAEIGIPAPKTLLPGCADAKELNFPLAVKPRRSCGAKGFRKIDTEEEFGIWSAENSISEFVIQEYVEQTDRNYSANLFLDNDGTVKSAFVYRSLRWFPLKGGTGTFNQLVDRPDVLASAEALAHRLNLRGWVGFDLIDDPTSGTAKIIEVNPRIMACAKIGFDGGIDMGLMILQKEFGGQVAEQLPKKTGICVRMSQTDVLWFLKSEKRFRCKPSWFSGKNTKDQTFSWDDPLPWFAFLLRGLKNYRYEMNLREEELSGDRIKTKRMKLVAREGAYSLYEYRPTLFRPLYESFEPLRFVRRVRLMLEYLHKNHFLVFYLATGGELCGYCVAARGGRRLKCSTGNDIVIGPYLIKPSRRGEGLSKVLIRMLLRYYPQEYDCVYDWIEEKNTASIRATESCGFERIGALKVVGRMRRLVEAEDGDHYIFRKSERE